MAERKVDASRMPKAIWGLAGKDLLSFSEMTADALIGLVEWARVIKRWQRVGRPYRPLEGRSVALIFEKPSMRTRLSFDVGVSRLGGHPVYVSGEEIGLGKREEIRDVARVLSRYVDAVVLRTFGQERLEELANFARVPVINALSDRFHPTQLVADLLTILEKRSKLCGVTVAWIGDGNNVLNSWLQAAALCGMHLRIATPPGFEPDDAVATAATQQAAEHGGSITLFHDPVEAVHEAEVLYTDVWTSMGQEEEAEKRSAAFAGFQVDATLLAHAAPDALVMHCLPAHRGQEISEAVLEGSHSVVFDEAENRLYAHEAILDALLRIPGKEVARGDVQ